MKTLLAVFLGAVCTLTACSSSGKPAGTAAPTCDLQCTESQMTAASPANPDYGTDFPTDEPLVTDEATTPDTLTPGQLTTITDTIDTAASFDLAVGKPRGLAAPLDAKSDYVLGLPVTLSNVDGTPSFDPNILDLIPGAEDEDDGSGDTDALTQAIDHVACGSLPMMGDLLDGLGMGDGSGTYPLDEGMESVTACITFSYAVADRPSAVSVYDGIPLGSPDDVELATWPLVLPKARSVTKPKPPKISYKITGNGSESSVITYTEGANSAIEQSTNARLPWTKKVSPDGNFFSLSAQDSNGTSITCEIDDTDGTVLDKHTAHGLYAIASCESSS